MPVFLQDVDVLVITDVMEEKTNYFFLIVFGVQQNFPRDLFKRFWQSCEKRLRPFIRPSAYKKLYPRWTNFYGVFLKFVLKYVLNVEVRLKSVRNNELPHVQTHGLRWSSG